MTSGESDMTIEQPGQESAPEVKLGTPLADWAVYCGRLEKWLELGEVRGRNPKLVDYVKAIKFSDEENLPAVQSKIEVGYGDKKITLDLDSSHPKSKSNKEISVAGWLEQQALASAKLDFLVKAEHVPYPVQEDAKRQNKIFENSANEAIKIVQKEGRETLTREDIKEILAEKVKKGKLVLAVGVPALVAAACGGLQILNSIPTPDHTGETVTPITETWTPPTSIFTPDLLSSPEKEAREIEDIIVFDDQEGSLWELSDKDLSLIGSPTGMFEGWVDKDSVSWAGEDKDSPDVRFGRWMNEGGYGIIKFEKDEHALISPDGIIINSTDGTAWQITDEDKELVGDTPGHFDGWISEESLTEKEKQEGIRWGLWSNKEGRGKIRFVEVSIEAP
jgi:hypothetical protein